MAELFACRHIVSPCSVLGSRLRSRPLWPPVVLVELIGSARDYFVLILPSIIYIRLFWYQSNVTAWCLQIQSAFECLLNLQLPLKQKSIKLFILSLLSSLFFRILFAFMYLILNLLSTKYLYVFEAHQNKKREQNYKYLGILFFFYCFDTIINYLILKSGKNLELRKFSES